MNVDTKAHGPVEVLFHVFIDSKSPLKTCNFTWHVGAFSTFEKGMEAANGYIKEAVPFKEVHWEQEGDGWKPIVSGVVSNESGRCYKMVWKLRVKCAVLDSRTHHGGNRGWNWVSLNPQPEVMAFFQQDMENMEDVDLLAIKGRAFQPIEVKGEPLSKAIKRERR